MYNLIIDGDSLCYSDDIEGVDITIPAKYSANLITFTEPVAPEWADICGQALANPLGCNSLREIAQGCKKVAIVIPDATRGVPVHKILPPVVNELTAVGVKMEQIGVIIATGVHRPANQREIKELLGPLFGRLHVTNHNPWAEEELVNIGTTSYGTPVEVNRMVYESDLRIAIGKVEPHEFAGFSGGRKAVLPGIAGEKSIEINHRPEMLLNSQARPGILVGNPISEDMTMAAEMLGLDFVVNVVQSQEGEVIGVFAGEMQAVLTEAVEFLRSFCNVELTGQADIVVTTPGRPLNIDFYQSLKAIIALEAVVAPGGTIVFYSECPDGLGTSDMFTPYRGAKTINDVIANLKSKYKIQMDHALLVSRVLARGIKSWRR
jgi:nickel-dependent lactate racemase